MVGVLVNKSLLSGQGYHSPNIIYSLSADLGKKREKSIIIIISVLSHLILMKEKKKQKVIILLSLFSFSSLCLKSNDFSSASKLIQHSHSSCLLQYPFVPPSLLEFFSTHFLASSIAFFFPWQTPPVPCVFKQFLFQQ